MRASIMRTILRMSDSSLGPASLAPPFLPCRAWWEGGWGYGVWGVGGPGGRPSCPAGGGRVVVGGCVDGCVEAIGVGGLTA